MIASAIITAPRPRKTILDSLQSYREAGFTDEPLFVCAEPGSFNTLNEAPVDFTLIQNTEQLGNLRNWDKAARTLLNVTNEPWLMICEDDITWALNACDRLMYDLPTINHGGVGALSLYCPARMSKLIEQTVGARALRFGWYHCAIGRKMWGAQCLLFKRIWLENLLAHPLWAQTLADPTVDKNVDAWIAETILQQSKTILYRIPCLVDHVLGDQNSSLYGEKDRPDLRTKYFKGVA